VTTNIANLLTVELGKPEEALKVLHHTESNYAPQRMDEKIQLTAQLLGTYTYLKKYGPAQRYCNRLLALSDTLGKNDLQQQVLYSNIIRFFLASKQHEKARTYLTTYTQFADNTHSLKSSSEIQLFWFKLDSTEANYPLAIKHYQQYKLLQDSLYDETKIKQMASLEVQFETEQKEKNLQLKEQRIQTLTNEKLLQEQKSKKDNLILNFSIGGAILLLLLLILVYNRYRLKQRSTRLLEAKQQEINLKNTSLQQVLGEKEELLVHKDALLEEKEWLLKEIHHRVKNNLQIVMSLLNSQAAHLKDGKALSAIQESQQRVHAISLIHQKLYQSEKVALIQMDSYIREVANYLKESFNDGDRIRFELAIVPLELDIAIAVPLGLIINEAITNCLKYAFPHGGEGVIGINLGPVDGMNYLLTIEDDGIGLSSDFDISRTRTLGMNLIKGLSKQLKAGLQVESIGGLKISLLFNNAILVKSFADQPLPG
jgi:two-component sensor histidine kinase